MLTYFLPAIIALGAVTSYEDLKSNSIRNKWIVSAIAYAVIVNLILLLAGSVDDSPKYYMDYGVNMVFALITGILLWHYSICTAADSKLYIAFSSLLPLGTYSAYYLELMPSASILLNTFIFGALFLIVTMILRFRPGMLKLTAKKFVKEFFNPKNLLMSALMIISISWLLRYSLEYIGISLNFIMQMFLIYIIMAYVREKAGKRVILIFAAIAFMRVIFDRSIISFEFLLSFITLTLTWRFLRSFLKTAARDIAYEYFTRDVRVDDLKVKMRLADTIGSKDKLTVSDRKRMMKYPNIRIHSHKGKIYVVQPAGREKSPIVGPEPGGLNRRQISKIRDCGLENIRIKETIPFAPFIFIGVLLTILLKGNILILL